MSNLSGRIHTFGHAMMERHGERVHKIALDAGFTCPNRDGTKGIGGCTFCNNDSFSPGARDPAPLGRADRPRRAARIAQRTGAHRFLAYFQAYTNTYADVDRLRALYDEALALPDVIGLSVGTRPDCVPPPVLDLLAGIPRRRARRCGWNWACNRPSTTPWRGSIAATASPSTRGDPGRPRRAACRSAPT